MTIGITGATGQLGRLVVARLRAQQQGTIIGLVRSAAKAGDLGIAVREADYSKPSTLETALQGIDVLLLISSNEFGQRAAQHRNVIDAAGKAGVKWIVYTSLLHADSTPLAMLASEHVETEQALRASGIAHTILRNGWYAENYTASIPGALAGGAFLGSARDGKISAAARADYADAAAVVLAQGAAVHAGKVYELAGDSAWTLADLAAEISRQTGRNIPYRDLPEADYAAALAGFGLPVAVANAYANFDAGAAQDGLFDGQRQLSALTGKPTTPLAVSVSEALQANTPA